MNLDKSNLNTYVKFGSTYEFFRVAVQNIILAYPGSLFANSNAVLGGNVTFYDFNYNPLTDIATFKIPYQCIGNPFNLIFNTGNTNIANGALSNVNVSYDKYVVWTPQNSSGNSYYVIGFTGYIAGMPSSYVTVTTLGNPFPFNSGATYGKFDFHIKPNNVVFEEFRSLLTDYEQYIVASRDGTNGFQFNLNDPSLLDDGTVVYTNTTMLWTTTDGYNIDTNTTAYQKFLNSLLAIGAKYDVVKTDLIARFLTPASIKTYDTTEDQKMTKLLRVYGWEFDQLKKFIDSLVNINVVTYDKLNNIPDQLVSNLAKTFGWNYFNLVNESELMQSIFSVDTTERNLHTDLLPAEVNIELWRRILINTNYFWKSKGTRHAIRAIFLLIGIPDPFINITEYVYTVNGKINPNTVPYTPADFPNSSLPYDSQGYPQAPLESSSFFFQISGDTDSGQAYMNNFRKAGFSLMQTVDNKKSWLEAGATTRVHYDTPQYYQLDSKLVLNTKETDVALDTARGIEYDVYDYILKDFAINSTGYTLPFSYVNISLGVSMLQNKFTLPYSVNTLEGNFEVRYNGILLNAPTLSGATELTRADYTVTGNSFTLANSNYAHNSGNRRDVIQATFIYSGGTHPVTGITVEYIVTRVHANVGGTYIPLPSYPRGDVQVTVNGIALTKGTPQFIADYILNPANSISGTSNIIIQNPEVISYLAVNPEIQIAYVQVIGSNDINARSEITRVDSFNSSKIYYNAIANKFVYKLNYKVNSASDVKMLINGIALEPYTDYNVNALNPYEIFLPAGINYGTVISAYYLIAHSAYFNPIISNRFGLGDITQLSFLEFIELIQRRLINARTRKTISDFKGGWYPALLNVYIQYLERGLLSPTDPLHSNGYTFANLYPFLSKYNAFFQRFVDELLPATIILKQGGLLIRNTVFTKQKFMYKRGVNLYSTGSTAIDMRGNAMFQYLGDDGSQFLITQPTLPPPPPVPVLYVGTVAGTAGIGTIINFGGSGVTCSTGLNQITEYGVQYRAFSGDPWTTVFEIGAPVINNYTMSAIGLLENTTYTYQAYIKSGTYIAWGNLLSIKTLATPAIPGLYSLLGSATPHTISSGGINITGGTCAQWYGMQYRKIGVVTYDIAVSPTTLSMPATCTTCSVSVSGCTWDTYSIVSSAPSWISATCTPPSPTGTLSQITACANTGAARSGEVCYIPLSGSTKYVTINQACGVSPYKNVSMLCVAGGYTEDLCVLSCGCIGSNSPISPGECYSVNLGWHASNPTADYPLMHCIDITCNNYLKYSCNYCSNPANSQSGTFGTMLVKYGDIVNVTVYADAQSTAGSSSISSVVINSVTQVSGCFCLGKSCDGYSTELVAQTLSTCVSPGPPVEV